MFKYAYLYFSLCSVENFKENLSFSSCFIIIFKIILNVYLDEKFDEKLNVINKKWNFEFNLME